MKARLAFFALLLASAAHAQAPSPAQIGVSPTPPQSLFWLDSTKTWRPLPTPGSPAGAKCDGVTDDAPAFNAMIAAGAITYVPGCAQPYYLGSDVSLPNRNTQFQVEPTASFAGPGKLKLDALMPFAWTPNFSNDAVTYTITGPSTWQNGYFNNYLLMRRGVNKGDVSVNPTTALVALYGEGESAGNKAPAWGANLVGFCTAPNCTVWGAEVDVGAMAASAGSGSTTGVLIGSVGDLPSVSAIDVRTHSATSGWKVGLLFENNYGNAPGAGFPLFGNYGLSRVIYLQGNTATPYNIYRGLDFFDGTFSNGAIVLPKQTTAGNGIWFGDDVSVFRNGPSSLFVNADLAASSYNGKVRVGEAIFSQSGATTALTPIGGATHQFQFIGTTAASRSIDFGGWGTSGGALGFLDFAISRAASPASFAAVQQGDYYGLNFYGDDGTNMSSRMAFIQVTALNPVSTGVVPGRFNFSTANSSGVMSQAFQIGSDQRIGFTSANSFTANGSVATTMTSLGPTGASTTVKKWLTITDNAGATLYIPTY